jgi:hypothetical protein
MGILELGWKAANAQATVWFERWTDGETQAGNLKAPGFHPIKTTHSRALRPSPPWQLAGLWGFPHFCGQW